MAVKDPDHEARANPVTNFVAGAGAGKMTKFITAYSPDGTAHKLNADNVADWRTRGPNWTIGGPWAEDAPATPAETEPEDTDELDAADTAEREKEMLGHNGETADVALKELHALKAEASLLGIKINDTWGKRRLNAEIAAAKLRTAQTAAAAAAAPAPAAPAATK